MNKIALLTQFSIEAIRDAVQKLDDFDNFILNGLNAYQLNEIEMIDPVLFSEIAKKIKTGRWFPLTGLWYPVNRNISQEELTRSEIYASKYFSEKFSIRSRTFFSEGIINNMLPQTAYNAGFDLCVIDGLEKEIWLDSCEETRVYACPMPEYTDLCDIDDDFIKQNEFSSVEDYLLEKFSFPMDIDTVVLPCEHYLLTDTEKALLDFEFASTANGKDVCEETEILWKRYFEGKKITVPTERPAVSGFINILNKNISIDSFRPATDRSGEYILRIRETDGTDGQVYVVCNKLDFGFKCEMTPFKTSTFLIDREGFVTESLLT